MGQFSCGGVSVSGLARHELAARLTPAGVYKYATIDDRQDVGVGSVIARPRTQTDRREPMVSLPAALVSLALFGAGETVLLQFSADWCAPCRAMTPIVQSLQAKGYPVRKVNVDQERALAQRYGVTSLPTFVMLVDGREVDRKVGGGSLGQLEQMLRLAPNKNSPRPSEAAVAAAPGDPRIPQVLPVAASLPAPGTNARPDRKTGPDGSHDSAPLWAPRRVTDEQLIAATVRLRIQDPRGHSNGTGTLIDARGGEALILTCGHIFRDSQGKGRIEVDLFGPHASQRIPGRLVAFDLKTDVGLVAIRVPGSVSTARVAPPGYQLEAGQSVVSVGCDNGADPTARHSRVNSLNKFLGPANVQVAGQPVEGRSGGGLFSAEGYVVGVCNAADPQDREGLFAAAECIYAILDQAGLTYVYDPNAAAPAEPSVTDPTSRLATVAPPAADQPVARGSLEEIQWPSGAEGAAPPVRAVSATREGLPTLDRDERIAMDEIRRRLDDGYEVVCIIRPRDAPRANSEVLVLDKVSAAFLKNLEAAARATEAPRFTSSRQEP